MRKNYRIPYNIELQNHCLIILELENNQALNLFTLSLNQATIRLDERILANINKSLLFFTRFQQS